MFDFYIGRIYTARSFVVFPLSLTLPGKGVFRKLIGANTTYSGRPVYSHSDTGEMIFFRGEFWVIMIERK